MQKKMEAIRIGLKVSGNSNPGRLELGQMGLSGLKFRF